MKTAALPAPFPGAGAQSSALRYTSDTDTARWSLQPMMGALEPHPAFHWIFPLLSSVILAMTEVQCAIGETPFSGSTFRHREREKPSHLVRFHCFFLKVAFICNGCISRARTLSKQVTPSRKGTIVTWVIKEATVEFSAIRIYNEVFFQYIKKSLLPFIWCNIKGCYYNSLQTNCSGKNMNCIPDG